MSDTAHPIQDKLSFFYHVYTPVWDVVDWNCRHEFNFRELVYTPVWDVVDWNYEAFKRRRATRVYTPVRDVGDWNGYTGQKNRQDMSTPLYGM